MSNEELRMSLVLQKTRTGKDEISLVNTLRKGGAWFDGLPRPEDGNVKLPSTLSCRACFVVRQSIRYEMPIFWRDTQYTREQAEELMLEILAKLPDWMIQTHAMCARMPDGKYVDAAEMRTKLSQQRTQVSDLPADCLRKEGVGAFLGDRLSKKESLR